MFFPVAIPQAPDDFSVVWTSSVADVWTDQHIQLQKEGKIGRCLFAGHNHLLKRQFQSRGNLAELAKNVVALPRFSESFLRNDKKACS